MSLAFVFVRRFNRAAVDPPTSAQAGYHVSLSYAYGPDGRRVPTSPFDVDGVILGGQDHNRRRDARRVNVPGGSHLTSEQGLDGISTVAVDGVRGARLVAEHLLWDSTDVITLRVQLVGCSDATHRLWAERARPTTSNPSSFG